MPPFEIVVDSTMLRAVLRGYWDVATANLYAAELVRNARLIAHRSPRWLIDVSGFTVQSGEVTTILATALADARGKEPPMVALVAHIGKNVLGAMQSRRASGDGMHRAFDSVEAAERWLRGEPDG